MDKRQDIIEKSRTIPTDNWYKVGYILSIGDEKGAAKIIDHRLGNAGHMQQRALLLYMDSFTDIGHEEHIYSCDEKTATDSFDSCESIGCIRGNAVVLFACRELFTCSCLILFPISRHVGNFLL